MPPLQWPVIAPPRTQVRKSGQTEGLLRSLAGLLGVDVGVPDHTTFSRRSPGLSLAQPLARAQRTGLSTS